MRLVLDTNVAVAGLLWAGPPNEILRLVRNGRQELLLSNPVTAELERVLQDKKFKSRIQAIDSTPQALLAYYQNLGIVIPIVKEATASLRDKDDKIFLGLALNGGAQLIISGDRHLLDLKTFHHISIVTPREALRVIERLAGGG